MNRTATTDGSREIHPIAELFPMLDGDELDALVHDIKNNGLRQPIVLDGDGRVLDGRNRLAACAKANVTPDFITYDGDAPELFVISANVHRRHMTIGQRAMITAIALKSAGKRRAGRWVRGSVPPDTSGSGSSGWAQRMAEAGMVLDSGSGLADQVAAGRVTLASAVESIRPRPETKPVDMKVTPTEPNVITITPAVRQGPDDDVPDGDDTHDPDELRRALASGVTVAIAAEEARASSAPARPDPEQRPRRRRQTRASDLNPVQRKQRSAARESADESALAEVVEPINMLLSGLDNKLRDAGLAKLTGKPRQILADDLVRFGKTIQWALDQLGHLDGGE